MVSNRKILIVPDKFKGSLSAPEVADAIEEAIKMRAVHISEVEIEKVPMADGGDGSLDIMYTALSKDTSSRAHLMNVECCDPLRRPIKAPILLFHNNGEQCAFIEMARCCGLTLLKEEERDPLKTDTFGLGLMIRAAADAGAQKIIIGIGGSATNDMGYGIWGEEGSISPEEIVRMCENISFQIACDVENPLLGPSRLLWSMLHKGRKLDDPSATGTTYGALCGKSTIFTETIWRRIAVRAPYHHYTRRGCGRSWLRLL